MPPAVRRASPSGDDDGWNTGDQSSVSQHAGVDDCRLRGRRRDQQFGQRSDATAGWRLDADAESITDTDTVARADAIAKSDTVANAVAEPNANAVSDAFTHADTGSHTDTDTGSHTNANAARLFGAGAATAGLCHHAIGPPADPLGQRHARVPPQLRCERVHECALRAR